MIVLLLSLTFVGATKLLVEGWRYRSSARVRLIENHIGIGINSSKNSVNVVFTRLQNLLAGNFLNPWATDELVVQTLRQSRDGRSLNQFRRSQLLSMFTVQSAIVAWSILRSILHRPVSLGFTVVLLVLTVPLSGWTIYNRQRNKVVRLGKQIDQELGGILDLLAFSVSAGEPVILAIERVANLCSCETAKLLSEIPRQLASGYTITQGLNASVEQTSSPSFGRSIRAVQTALDRGTPIAGVLRAQAASARSLNQQNLMQLAGKKEAAMMMPVVFFILPMIVFISLYPGLSALQLT